MRRLIFLIFLTVLAISIASMLLYASGWRLDIAHRSLVRVGALFIDPYPEDARILLGGIPRKTTSMLSPNAIFTDLAPGRYAIEVGREGFHPWEKSLEILPQQTTDARHILLFPVQTSKNALVAGLPKDIMIFPPPGHKTKIVAVIAHAASPLASIVTRTRIESGRILPKSETMFPVPGNLAIREIRLPYISQEKSFLLRAQRLKEAEEASFDSIWFLGGKELPHEIQDIVFSPLKPQDSATVHVVAITRQPLETPGGEERWVEILQFDSTTGMLRQTKKLRSGVRAIAAQKNRVLAFDDRGMLFAISREGTFDQLTLVPLFVEDENAQVPHFEIVAHPEIGDRVALRSAGGDLYLLDAAQKTFVPIAEGVAGAVFSKNGEKLLWHTNHELWVLYLVPQEDQPKHEPQERELLARFLAPIRTALWFPGGEYHVLFAVGNAIKVAELDGRDKRNIHDVFVGDEPQFVVREDLDGIIVFDEGTLWHVALPIPPRYDLGILRL